MWIHALDLVSRSVACKETLESLDSLKGCRDHIIMKWNQYWWPSWAAMVQTAPDRDFYFMAQRTMNLADEKRWTWRPISHSAASLGPIMRWISIMPLRRCEMDRGGSCYCASRGPSSPLVQIELMEQKSHFDFFALTSKPEPRHDEKQRAHHRFRPRLGHAIGASHHRGIIRFTLTVCWHGIY